MRRPLWAALLGGGLSAALTVVSLISRDWIEFLFGLDPDGGDGGLEWGIVVVTAVTAIMCFWWARVEWQRARFSEATHHG